VKHCNLDFAERCCDKEQG